jgi:hypothetical protein
MALDIIFPGHKVRGRVSGGAATTTSTTPTTTTAMKEEQGIDRR